MTLDVLVVPGDPLGGIGEVPICQNPNSLSLLHRSEGPILRSSPCFAMTGRLQTEGDSSERVVYYAIFCRRGEEGSTKGFKERGLVEAPRPPEAVISADGAECSGDKLELGNMHGIKICRERFSSRIATYSPGNITVERTRNYMEDNLLRQPCRARWCHPLGG